jgi:hypothetical protein
MESADARRESKGLAEIRAEALVALLADIRERVKAAHDGVCACPSDGSDPDCHLSGGLVLAILAELDGAA